MCCSRQRLQTEDLLSTQRRAANVSLRSLCPYIGFCICVCVYTLIRGMCCSNSELWKGQTLTFVCDSVGKKRDMMRAAWNGLHANVHTVANTRQIRTSLWLWPLFSDPASLREIQAEKFFFLFCYSGSLGGCSPPTLLPLTPSQRTSSSWWNHSSCLCHRICPATDHH